MDTLKTCPTCRHFDQTYETVADPCRSCSLWKNWEPNEKLEVVMEGPVVSDGGSTSYYDLPTGSTELNDLIEHKKMSFALGNIFKACYRLGEKSGTDAAYDVRKMIFFANRILKQLEKTNA